MRSFLLERCSAASSLDKMPPLLLFFSYSTSQIMPVKTRLAIRLLFRALDAACLVGHRPLKHDVSLPVFAFLPTAMQPSQPPQ
jgi:hypothetical protein